MQCFRHKLNELSDSVGTLLTTLYLLYFIVYSSINDYVQLSFKLDINISFLYLQVLSQHIYFYFKYYLCLNVLFFCVRFV